MTTKLWDNKTRNKYQCSKIYRNTYLIDMNKWNIGVIQKNTYFTL